MRNILDLLRKQEPTSAALKQALADLPSDNGSATIAALERRRTEALLDGLVGSDVDAIEREIIEAVRERDRAALFREKLQDRIATAEKLEALDALAARKAAAEQEARDVAKLFENFDDLLGQLAVMLRRSDANYRECVSVNEALLQAGSTDRVVQTARKNFGYTETALSRLVHGVV